MSKTKIGHAWDTLDPDASFMQCKSPHGSLTIFRRGSTLLTTNNTLSEQIAHCFAKNKISPPQSQADSTSSLLNEFYVPDLCKEGEYWKVDQDALRKKSRKRLYSAPVVISSESIKLPPHIDVEAVIEHSFGKLCGDKNRKLICGEPEEREDPSAARMKEAYESLLKREQTYVKGELEPFLEYNDMTELRKKENLHKKWVEQVGEPIRREIDQQIHSRRLPALERRRQQLYDDYLTHVNRKGHVFLDVIAPDEYYALALQAIQPHLLKAKTKRLRDPTLGQYRSRLDEDRVEMRCLSGSFLTDKDIEQIRLPPMPLVPLGREGVNAVSWVRMPLVDIDSPERRASRHRMQSSGTRSSINFGVWSRTPFSREIVDAELQLQKKRHFPQQHASRPHKAPTRQPRPHPPRYEPRAQAEPHAIEPQLEAVEPQPPVAEPQPSTVEPQPSTFEPQPSTVEPGPPMQDAEPQPQPQPTQVPQPPMEKPQAQLSVPEPQPKPITSEPQPNIHTNEPQPHAIAPVQGALIPPSAYIIAC